MSEFLTTSGCSFYLEAIVREAASELIIISPYIKMNDWIFDVLMNSKSEVNKTIVYGKIQNQDGINRIKKLTNCRLFFKENLHAKCYMNESKGLITSLNMYDYSQINNIEYGIAISKSEDSVLFETVYTENNLLIKSSDLVNITNQISNAQESGIKMGGMVEYTKGKKFKKGTLKNEIDSIYLALCRYAMTIYDFNDNELYQDKAAIYRNTIISEDLKLKIIEFIDGITE